MESAPMSPAVLMRSSNCVLASFRETERRVFSLASGTTCLAVHAPHTSLAIPGRPSLTTRPGHSFRKNFRHVQLSVHEQGEFKCPADGHHIGLCENELTGPLPVVP